MSRVLVIDDDRALCRSIQIQLEAEGHEVRATHAGGPGLDLARAWSPDLIFLDLVLPDGTGLDVLQALAGERPELPVVMITGTQDTRATITAMRLGAFDYIRKPIARDDLLIAIEKAQRTGRSAPGPAPGESQGEREGEVERAGIEIVGRNPRILEVVKQIGLLSRGDVTVLITGESGTGKELVARALHETSAPGRPFVAINCSSIVATLPESELFGHEKGAFTGADRRKIGRLEHAGEGTLFLDEIGDLAPELQARLLRVLQEREFERVGGLETLPFKARVVSATNRDLEAMVASGGFRRDLFYRLAVATIHVPPLRERRDDIPLLVEHLGRKIARGIHHATPAIDAAVMARLQAYDWPGNVRELENVLARAIALGRGAALTAAELEFQLGPLRVDAPASRAGEPAAESVSGSVPESVPESGGLSLREVEERHVARVLELTGGNITRTARLLEISPTTLRKKIEEYGLRG